MTDAISEVATIGEPQPPSPREPLQFQADATGDPFVRWIWLSLIGGFCAILVLTLLQYFQQSKMTDIAAFVILLGVIPLIAMGICAWVPNPRPWLLVASKTFLATAMVVVLGQAVGALALPHGRVSATYPISIGFIAAGIAAGLFSAPMVSAQLRSKLNLFVTLLLALSLIAILVVFSPIEHDAPGYSNMLAYFGRHISFAYWLIPGFVFAGIAVWLIRNQRNFFFGNRTLTSTFALSIGVLGILCFYDDTNFVDLSHYQPFVGPALLASAGGVPMADVYCQYGLIPWALIALAYKILPATVGTAGIVVRVVNSIYYLAFILIVFAVARRRIAAMMLMFVALLAAITFMPGLYRVPDLFNINATPSVTGMRFLPVAIMALVTVFDPHRKAVRIARIVVLAVSSLWSLESFVFTMLPWAGALGLEGMRERRWRKMVLDFISGLLATLLAHALFAFVVFVWTGRVVDYRPYFDLFMTASGLEHSSGGGQPSWSILANYGFLWWVPVWLAIILTLSSAGVSALRGESRDRAARLIGLALFGISALTYFATRSIPATIGLAILPFASLVVLAFESIILNYNRTGITVKSTAALMVIAIALTFAFSFERFARPVAPELGNASVLRHCFTADGCSPGTVMARLRAATGMTADPVYFGILGDEAPVRINDLVTVLRTYVPHDARPAILPDPQWDYFAGYVALSTTGQWYAWPVGSVINESLSPINLKRILSNSEMHQGQILIVAKPESGLVLLEQKILHKLRAECRFSLLAETKYNSVYRADECQTPSGHDLSPRTGTGKDLTGRNR